MTFSKTYKNITENDLTAIVQDLAYAAIFPSVYCFHGDLGAGKTTFCRLFIRTLLDKPHYTIPSPTFTILQEYHAARGKIAHFDFYRIQNELDLIELNLDDYFYNYLCLIEWPNNVKPYLPEKQIGITITKITDDTRDILITSPYPF